MIDYLVNKIGLLAKQSPNKLAVAFKKDKLTYKELYEKSIGLSYVLRDIGLDKGDMVTYSALSKVEMVVYYLAIQMIGGIAVFLDKNSTPENMYNIYNTCDSKALITDKPMGEYKEKCNIYSLKELYNKAELKEEDITINPSEDSISEILFTTGTTGQPKGVMLSYKAIYNILSNTIEGVNIEENDILLLPLPLNHSFALRVLRATLYKGATVILQNGFTFASEAEKNINEYKVNRLAMVPASYEVLKSQMQDNFKRVFENMKAIEFGAGSLTVGQRKEIVNLLPNVYINNSWGSSESGGAIFCDINEIAQNEETIYALGKPLKDKVEVKFVDKDNNEIKSTFDNPGRMCLKGDMIMSGYYKADEITKETIVDGWLLTGDLAYMKGEYIYMLGRADDIINVGGEKVSPIEVENVASLYSGINDCACIGIEDPNKVLGQVPCLFVVTKPNYNENELISFLSSKLEKYKMPQQIIILNEIPRNRMKKIDRKALKQLSLNTNNDKDLMNPVINTILSRHSIRKFIDKEIPKEVLDIILKCGYHAPSGHNMQTWKFTVIEDKEKINKLKELTKQTANENKVHFYGWENPQVLILVSNDSRNDNGCQDASCASENIMLAANSLGLGCVWLNPLVTLRDKYPVKEYLDELEIPENHIIWSTIALGYSVTNGTALAKKDNVINYIDR